MAFFEFSLPLSLGPFINSVIIICVSILSGSQDGLLLLLLLLIGHSAQLFFKIHSFFVCLGFFGGEGGESYSGTIRKTCIEWHIYAELWSFQQ
jgi:hypothetical protein